MHLIAVLEGGGQPRAEAPAWSDRGRGGEGPRSGEADERCRRRKSAVRERHGSTGQHWQAITASGPCVKGAERRTTPRIYDKCLWPRA